MCGRLGTAPVKKLLAAPAFKEQANFVPRTAHDVACPVSFDAPTRRAVNVTSRIRFKAIKLLLNNML
jgi:hypothetical protein